MHDPLPKDLPARVASLDDPARCYRTNVRFRDIDETAATSPAAHVLGDYRSEWISLSWQDPHRP